MDNNLKIINYLGKNIGSQFTMNELSRTLSIPYATFHRTVQKIQELVVIQTIGHSKTISLNINKPSLKSYLSVASAEEKSMFLKNQPIIKQVCLEINNSNIVLLFGSYAKQKQREHSDIDLLIINKDGKRSISFSKQELLFSKKINPIFVTEKEFRLMLNEKEENVGKQAVNNHIILNNPELFWDLVLNVRKSIPKMHYKQKNNRIKSNIQNKSVSAKSKK